MTITALLIFATTTLIASIWVTYESGHPNPTRAYRALRRLWDVMEHTVTAAADRFWEFVLRRTS